MLPLAVAEAEADAGNELLNLTETFILQRALNYSNALACQAKSSSTSTGMNPNANTKTNTNTNVSTNRLSAARTVGERECLTNERSLVTPISPLCLCLFVFTWQIDDIILIVIGSSSSTSISWCCQLVPKVIKKEPNGNLLYTSLALLAPFINMHEL